MNYKPLNIKWRPKIFNDIIGQDHVLRFLKNSFLDKKIYYSYLISGIRGIGKTTLARLIAKSLNCFYDINFNPCRICKNCEESEKNCFVDLIEIDAASHTKIENIKEVLDNIKYLPSKGRYKIYIIDEVHMLSKYSFNALLKILEEPPNHVKFILATTELNKIPETILSRCLHLQLKEISETDILYNLKKILKLEKIYYEEEALKIISKSSQHSMRDALTLAEKASILGENNILYNVVSDMLGCISFMELIDLFEIISLNKKEKLIFFFKKIENKSINWDDFLINMILIVHKVLFFKFNDTYKDPKKINTKKTKFYKLSKLISTNDLYKYYDIFLQGRKELSYSTEQKITVEITILRAFYFINENL
ncbi:dnaX [Wigglesworthia glossinidia endosymbiont of Glossina brevipalpis]|uniref:DNA polymerase III subunit gamma/tau n=1 Tax=Wigglesworthia glossinidia brevipalpis TaxID=36870 RepID=Q8D230_WIGBR|nr:dnaX [Wigglesworthia glossinidia endosymbiont of Glossina brevipalpis]